MTSLNAAIAEAIAAVADTADGTTNGTSNKTKSQPGVTHAVAGGDINTCLRYESAGISYFVKSNSHPCARSMFAAEAQVLTAMARNNCIRVPKPLTTGAYQNTQFLILEYVPLGGPVNWQALGRQLADLHRQEGPRFGWQGDNFIGTSTQYNGWLDDWAEFFWQRRLHPQLTMAIEHGYGELAGFQAPIHDACMRLLERHKPNASLVHGDLWAGNAGFSTEGEPVIYDPAGYFGDREVDLAMTELFGGFPREFYLGYDGAWSRPGHWQARVPLYNLYHLLNHLNLFGGGYLHQCLRTIDSIITR